MIIVLIHGTVGEWGLSIGKFVFFPARHQLEGVKPKTNAMVSFISQCGTPIYVV